MNTLARELAHSEARQREFLLSVSHDLRTPLTAISGYAESLADGMIAPDQAPHAGNVILAEAQRLNRLVADLLDLARLGSQEFRIDLADVDVLSVVNAAAPVWANRCAAVGVRFGIEAPDRPLVVRTDAARLRQMMDGLFDNALRVTPTGAPIVLAARYEQSGPSARVAASKYATADQDSPMTIWRWRSTDRRSMTATAACGRSAPDWVSRSCRAWSNGSAEPSKPATPSRGARASRCVCPCAIRARPGDPRDRPQISLVSIDRVVVVRA